MRVGSGSLAIDGHGLDAIKREAKASPDKALKSAAKQFEAIFMQMLLKSMRDAIPASDLMGGSESKMYTSMLDQELAARMGNGKGLGIADMIVKQLEQVQKKTGEGATAPQSGATPPALAPAREALQRLSGATVAAQGGVGATDAQRFVDSMLPHAAEAGRATGVPPRFILGQAALESGWGKREIRHADGTSAHNLFGMKAGKGWTGPTVDVTTTEYIGGAPRKVVERFRAYGSYAEGFADYARMLASSPRYAEVVRGAQDASSFAWRLQQAGYATDPAYAEKLTRVINHTLALQRVG